MTDKDLQQEQESQPQKTLAEQGKDAEESSLQEDLTQESIDAEGVEEEKSAPEMVKEQSPTSEKVEEDSLFLSQWQKKHQEYLESLKQQEASDEENSEAKSGFKKKYFPKKHFADDKATKKDEETAPSSKTDIPSKEPIPISAIWKGASVLFAALLLFMVSLYFMGPLSKKKNITVTGNDHLDTNSILASSLISKRDYAITTWLNSKGHARNIKASSAWVDSAQIDYEFPNKFTIRIKEYKEIGYQKVGNKYFSVLSSGNISEFPTPQNRLADKYTSINLADKELVKKLVVQLAQIDHQIVANIQSVDLTPSKVSKDLLTLNMYDGHSILVPLLDVKKKLPYYAKIAPQLTVPSTIDMEVGIFSYAK